METNYEECRQAERVLMVQENKIELEHTAQSFLSGEKNRLGNRPKPVRDLIDTKVSNYLKKHPSVGSVESIMEILGNPKEGDERYELCFSIFTKDPGKQNLAERAQLRCLRSVKNLDASKLNADGAGSLRFVDSELVWDKNKKDLKGRIKTKSIDFRVQHPNGNEELICAKDTRGSGGHQDNQCEDIKGFLREAVNFLDKNPHCTLKFTALVDGPYYNKNGKPTRQFNELREVIPNNLKNRIRVTNSDDF